MTLRPARDDERNFVRKAWLRGYASSDWALLVTPKDDDHTIRCAACARRNLRFSRKGGASIAHAGAAYWEGHHRLVDRLLGCSNVTVAEADDGLLDGFIVRHLRERVLHYLYVKPYMRGHGIARALVADLGEGMTRVTHLGQNTRLPSGWSFDPYALMEVA